MIFFTTFAEYLRQDIYMKKLLFLLSIIFITPTAANAQSITGRVIGNDGAPIADANVVLQSPESEYIGLEVTAEDGSFAFHYKADTFRLVVHHLAFHSRELLCTSRMVGDIIMEPSDVELGDVVISARASACKGRGGQARIRPRTTDKR